MDYEEILETKNISISGNDSIYNYHVTNAEIALECFKFMTCLVGTAADILMALIILKYKNIKKPLNIYIMNWLICDAMFIIADPSEYRLYRVLRGLESEREVLCVLFNCTLIIRTLDVIFMILLLVHWFFERTKIEIFEKHCFKIVTGVWVFGLIELIYITLSCIHDFVFIRADIGDIIFCVLLTSLFISLSIVHCMRRCSNPFNDESSLSVAMITSFILCWVCVLVITNLFHLVSHTIFTVFFYTGQLLIYLYPLVMFYLFYKLDPMFAVCARLLFRVTKPEETTATFAELDEDEVYEEGPHII